MKRGFTLAEIMIASVIILVVLTALAVALMSFARGSRAIELQDGALTLARLELAEMERSMLLSISASSSLARVRAPSWSSMARLPRANDIRATARAVRTTSIITEAIMISARVKPLFMTCPPPECGRPFFRSLSRKPKKHVCSQDDPPPGTCSEPGRSAGYHRRSRG